MVLSILDILDFQIAYRKAKGVQLEGLDNAEQLLDQLDDRLSAIRAIYEVNPGIHTLEGLKESIDSIFSDDKHGHVSLMTVHRAKGAEAERVFLYAPEDMPLSWKTQQDWQYQQERNLLYVALTRATDSLFIVESEPDNNGRQPEIAWFCETYLTAPGIQAIADSEPSEAIAPGLPLSHWLGDLSPDQLACVKDMAWREVTQRYIQSLPDDQLIHLFQSC